MGVMDKIHPSRGKELCLCFGGGRVFQFVLDTYGNHLLINKTDILLPVSD